MKAQIKPWVESINYISCDDGVEFVRVFLIYSPEAWRQIKNKPNVLDEVEIITNG